ncbi:hypothetical protein Nhal_2822 [Nitrosococcus halophilus Nc 4]|uniref:Uncharacterized protein n=1 Tax=Nitrosococcus halophilus (strain Nc4) TaxID=472759 RepID=D5BXX6_NITHN|nr:hypothetical protein [Nitrosococcus halophilus]ADE15887.1 hypothetical protein Nhal_2822 [Nitrosococcus halophilus Nc 4]
MSKDKPINLESVQRYLEKKFDDALDDAYKAMRDFARSMDTTRLAEVAYKLYEKFRPDIPEGKKGWGAEGTLSIDEIKLWGCTNNCVTGDL